MVVRSRKSDPDHVFTVLFLHSLLTQVHCWATNLLICFYIFLSMSLFSSQGLAHSITFPRSRSIGLELCLHLTGVNKFGAGILWLPWPGDILRGVQKTSYV